MADCPVTQCNRLQLDRRLCWQPDRRRLGRRPVGTRQPARSAATRPICLPQRSGTANGFAIGGQIGANYQLGAWVTGLEADADVRQISTATPNAPRRTIRTRGSSATPASTRSEPWQRGLVLRSAICSSTAKAARPGTVSGIKLRPAMVAGVFFRQRHPLGLDRRSRTSNTRLRQLGLERSNTTT